MNAADLRVASMTTGTRPSRVCQAAALLEPVLEQLLERTSKWKPWQQVALRGAIWAVGEIQNVCPPGSASAGILED